MLLPKLGRFKLAKDEYDKLRQRVLERDDWSCRRCGERQGLQVHHIIKRSFCRIDKIWNLVTLCNRCHELVERHVILVDGSDADKPWSDPEALRFRLNVYSDPD